MLDFGAFAGPKIVISAPILNYYNRNIQKSNKKKKKKKKKLSHLHKEQYLCSTKNPVFTFRLVT